MSLNSLLMGSKPKLQKLSTLTHSQKRLLEDLSSGKMPWMPKTQNNPMYQQAGQYLQDLLSQQPQERYAQLEAPYMRQFNEQIMPGIAEQYAGAGALGSSGFQNAAGNASSDLMERLAALNLNQQNLFRGQQMQALPMMQSLAQIPFNERLQRQQMLNNQNQLALGTQAFGYNENPGSTGLVQSGLGSLSHGFGTEFGKLLAPMAQSGLSSGLSALKSLFF